jgi:hypothetical protein
VAWFEGGFAWGAGGCGSHISNSRDVGHLAWGCGGEKGTNGIEGVSGIGVLRLRPFDFAQGLRSG